MRQGKNSSDAPNTKKNCGNCTIHYIRESVVRDILSEAVKRVVDYVTNYEPVFMYLYEKKHSENLLTYIRQTQNRIRQAKQRVEELDGLIVRVYEDYALGKLSENRYSMIAEKYESEQKKLREQIEEGESALSLREKTTIDLKTFINTIRQCTDIDELDEKLVNTLISKIVVFKKTKVDGKYYDQIKIHFTAVGIIGIPKEKEILATMAEMRSKKTS